MNADRSALHSVVQRLAARSPLTIEEQDAILNVRHKLEYVARNRNIWRPQLSERHVHVLVSGLTGVFRQARNGIRQITSIHVSGDIIGLEQIVASHLMLGLESLTDTSLLILSLPDLRRLADRYPAIAMAFWQESADLTRIIAERLFTIRSLGAYPRLAHLFCEMAIRSDAVPTRESKSFSFPFAANQHHIADVLALTPVHVNRMLRELRERNVMGLQNRSVTVHNWNVMQDVASFDAAYLRPRWKNAAVDCRSDGNATKLR